SGARLFRRRRDVDDLLPDLGRAFQILLAEGADDADVHQGLGVPGVDRQRPVELRQGLVGIVHVVICDSGIGADVAVRGVEPQRLVIPVAGLLNAARVEIHVAELDAVGGVGGVLLGRALARRRARLVEGGRRLAAAGRGGGGGRRRRRRGNAGAAALLRAD